MARFATGGKIVFRKLSVCFCVLALSAGLCFAQSSSSSPSDKNKSKDPDPSAAKDSATTKDTTKDKDDDAAFQHHEGINDINAIGRRNVGCDRGFMNWYSLDKQVAMGRSYAQQIEEQTKMVTDPKVTEYVNRIGQNLVRSSDSKLPFPIKVIDAEKPNAMTLPGGFMFVNSGAILVADDESELAGVMAHEIGHVAACHAARQNTRSTLAQIATIPLIFVGGPLVNLGINQALGLALPATFMKFSRGFEAQADYLGVQYAYKAGYDPVGMINFFEKLEALDKKRKGFITKAYESHPQTPDRVAKSQQEIGSILPPRDQYVIDTSEFQEIKARINALENHRKLKDDLDTARPDLRRTTNVPGSDKGQQKDDDRPTVKRNPGSN